MEIKECMKIKIKEILEIMIMKMKEECMKINIIEIKGI